MYGIEGSHDIMMIAESLPEKWKDLYARSKGLEFKLKSVKERNVTEVQRRLESHLERVARILNSFQNEGYYGRQHLPLEECFSTLQFYITKVSRIVNLGQTINSTQRLLKLPITTFHSLEQLRHDIEGNEQVFAVFKGFQDLMEVLNGTTLSSFNVDAVNQEMNQLHDKLKDVAVSEKGFMILSKLKMTIQVKSDCLTMINKLLKGHLRSHHWLKLFEEELQRPDLADMTNTKDFLNNIHVGLILHHEFDFLRNAVDAALVHVESESRVEEILDKISTKWKDARILLEKVTIVNDADMEAEQAKVVILAFKNSNELMEQLALDGQSLNALIGDYDTGEFHRGRMTKEKSQLVTMRSTLKLWDQVQQDCLVLARLFVKYGEKQLVGFEDDLKKYLRLMNEVMKKPSVKTCCFSTTMTRDIDKYSEVFRKHLTACSPLVDDSRQRMARLKLLTFREVLTILGGWCQLSNEYSDCNSGNNWQDFQAASVKLFGNGIIALKSSENSVTGLVTNMGEEMQFVEPVTYNPRSVESFLEDVLVEAKQTTREISHQRMGQKMIWPESLLDVTKTFQQVWHLQNEVCWSKNMEEKLCGKNPNRGVRDLLIRTIKHLNILLTGSGSEDKLEQTRKRNELNFYIGKKDLLFYFLGQDVSAPYDFLWSSVMKTTWDGVCRTFRIKQGHACLLYGYEVQPTMALLQETEDSRRISMAMITAIWKNMPMLVSGRCLSGKRTFVSTLVSDLYILTSKLTT